MSDENDIETIVGQRSYAPYCRPRCGPSWDAAAFQELCMLRHDCASRARDYDEAEIVVGVTKVR